MSIGMARLLEIAHQRKVAKLSHLALPPLLFLDLLGVYFVNSARPRHLRLIGTHVTHTS